MSDESYGILGLFAAMLSWVGINATWTHSLQKKVGRCAEKYVAKDDFQIFRTEQREDMKEQPAKPRIVIADQRRQRLWGWEQREALQEQPAKPRIVVAKKRSYTGKYLKKYFPKAK